MPQSLRAHRETLRRLGEVYKQLNAPFGTFSMSLLKASTRAIKSGSTSDDSTYTAIENQISSLTRSATRSHRRSSAALDARRVRGTDR